MSLLIRQCTKKGCVERRNIQRWLKADKLKTVEKIKTDNLKCRQCNSKEDILIITGLYRIPHLKEKK